MWYDTHENLERGFAMADAVEVVTPTAGEWSVSDYSGDVIDENGFPVAELPSLSVLDDWTSKFPDLRHWARGGKATSIERDDEEVFANALIIAAAKDLLAACESVIANAYLDDDVINRHPFTNVSCEALRKAVAAIAKAKGA